MLVLAQECFWWPMMVEDSHTLVRGCQWCCAFKGVISKVPLCPIWAHVPLELIHVDFTSVKSTMELNKPAPLCQECPCHHRSLYLIHSGHGNQRPDHQDYHENTLQEVYAVFGVLAKILSNRGANFTSTLVEELCAVFGIQKCRTTSYPAQCNGQVECFHQTLFCMIGKLASDKKPTQTGPGI